MVPASDGHGPTGTQYYGDIAILIGAKNMGPEGAVQRKGTGRRMAIVIASTNAHRHYRGSSGSCETDTLMC